MIAAALLIVGAGAAAEAPSGASHTVALRMASALGRAIETRARLLPVIDDPIWESCRSQDGCVGEVRARNQAGDVVLLRLFGGLRRVRLVAERFPVEGASVDFEINVPLDPNTWSAPLEQVARALFAPALPEVQAVATGTVYAPVFDPRAPDHGGEEVALAPWILMGSGVACAVVGAIFGLSSKGAREDSASPVLSDQEFDRLSSRAVDHGWTANVLFSLAGASAVAGVAWLVIE